MTMLNPKEIPTKVERIVISRLDNGYAVQGDTNLAGKVGHYCSNLKGVTKTLWAWFEGKEKLRKDQVQGVKAVLGNVKESLEKQREELEGDKNEERDAT